MDKRVGSTAACVCRPAPTGARSAVPPSTAQTTPPTTTRTSEPNSSRPCSSTAGGASAQLSRLHTGVSPRTGFRALWRPASSSPSVGRECRSSTRGGATETRRKAEAAGRLPLPSVRWISAGGALDCARRGELFRSPISLSVGIALEIARRRDDAPRTGQMFGAAALGRARVPAVRVDVAGRRDDDLSPGGAGEGAGESGALSVKGPASRVGLSRGDYGERGRDDEWCDQTTVHLSRIPLSRSNTSVVSGGSLSVTRVRADFRSRKAPRRRSGTPHSGCPGVRGRPQLGTSSRRPDTPEYRWLARRTHR